MYPPEVDAPPAEPEFSDPELAEDFPDNVAVSKTDDKMGVTWDPAETKDCYNIGVWIYCLSC